MFDVEIVNIAKITERVLGKPRHEMDANGWNEFNCPYCADVENVKSDGKYNCCINYHDGYFHCWKCGAAGKISRILRDYGGVSVVNEYYKEINEIRNSQQFRLSHNNSIIKKELDEIENPIHLPEKCSPITDSDRNSVPAHDYLTWRGLDDRIIKDFKIGYVPWSDDYKMRCRIVVPSYDQYNNLNYYVTRDYTGKQRLKYINANVDKKSIVFNENRINWCEDITLCEGVFDSFVIPNSIPLLGKVINEDFAVYDALLNRARANVNILLDDDAIRDAKKMYFFLNGGKLNGNIRLIECPSGYDASSFYQNFGRKGMLQLMRSARKLEDFELLMG